MISHSLQCKEAPIIATKMHMLTRWFPRRFSEETKIEEKLAPFCKVYDLLLGKDDEVTKFIIEREAEEENVEDWQDSST